MDDVLRVVIGGAEHVLEAGERFTFGRAASCTVQLDPDDPAISRLAGVIERDGPVWFLIKLVLAMSLFIWLRATLPRLRYDQLMRFGWKILLPVATVNAVVTALLVVIF